MRAQRTDGGRERGCEVRHPPAASGDAFITQTETPPEDSPKTVTRAGSPPKARTCACTQRSAVSWSRTPLRPPLAPYV